MTWAPIFMAALAGAIAALSCCIIGLHLMLRRARNARRAERVRREVALRALQARARQAGRQAEDRFRRAEVSGDV